MMDDSPKVGEVWFGAWSHLKVKVLFVQGSIVELCYPEFPKRPSHKISVVSFLSYYQRDDPSKNGAS